MIVLAAYYLLLAASQSLAALYTSLDSLPKLQYDFIVVGGGIGGSVIANRLSENPDWTVLVIESGPSNEGVLPMPLSAVLEGYFGLNLDVYKPYDWNYTTALQPGFNNRSITYPSGWIFGGGSSTNGLYYARGPASDYDRYANMTGDPGWRWRSLFTYILRSEVWTPPIDGHDTTDQFDPGWHSYTGMNPVSLAGFPQGLDHLVSQTWVGEGHNFTFVKDYNSGNPVGIGYLQMTVDKGKRSSSATSYLSPQFLARPNLDVVINSRALRIFRTEISNDLPVFRSVQVAQSGTILTKTLQASKEIILAAGVIGTPNLLLHSGIGNVSELNEAGVNPIVDLPDVGKNFSDHPLVALTWTVTANETMDDVKSDEALRNEYISEWNATQTGPFASISNSFAIWGQISQDVHKANNFTDPSSGLESPHYCFYPLNGGPYPRSTGQQLTIINLGLTPTSRGDVTLRSSNPFDTPIVNPKYLGSAYDRFEMRESARKAIQFVGSTAFEDYVLDPVDPKIGPNISDDDLDTYIADNARAGVHGVGTAAMSPEGATYGVVDPDLRVKGTIGLRVVDASVLPIVPAAHTQGPVYIMAERAADLIKESWGAPASEADFQSESVLEAPDQQITLSL